MVLQDGRIPVPKNPRAYRERDSFNKSINCSIDTTVFYEELYSDLLTKKRGSTWYSMMRFYGNGDMNIFHFYIDPELKSSDFDPNWSGYRGVYYLKGDEIWMTYYNTVNSIGIGPYRGKIETWADTLKVTFPNLPQYDMLFVKRPMPSEYFQFRADW